MAFSTQHLFAKVYCARPQAGRFLVCPAGVPMQMNNGSKRLVSFNDPVMRALLFQIMIVAAVLAMGWTLYQNTYTNLVHRGITSGFAFLENSAGFGVAQHLISYVEAAPTRVFSS